MSVKKFNAMLSIAIAYFLIGIHLVTSSSEFSLVLFKQIILSVTIASFIFSISDIITIYFDIKRLKNIENIDVENKNTIYNKLKDTFLNKNLTKSDKVVSFVTESLDGLALTSSICLIYIEITFSDMLLGILVVLSFSLYLLKIGLRQILKEIAHDIFSWLDTKQAINIANDAHELSKDLFEKLKTALQVLDKETIRIENHGSIQPHRKTVRRRYRTRPHPRRLP